ncbi:short-chain dehydrogenase ptmH-like [Salvia divinorum]|uniref:Short-chain dehydrogenase ptmH-like n=1 Tax=Salvia divinorum TaxID=28513 RepID=A0ABD1G9Q6_SALDI
MSERKVVLITGCGKGGIGSDYCKAFAELNCAVFASDVSQRLPDLADLQSDNVETLELDVSSDSSVASAVDLVISQRGKIDILINNAGIGSPGPLAELPLDAARKAYEINALGQLRMVQRVVPHMVACGGGSIVNVGSVVGEVPTPWAGSYCATKAYVHAMSHALRVELKPFGINVVLVLPGAVRSSFGSNNVDRLKDYEWKIYKSFSDSISERAKASQSGKSMDASVFARHVARQVLNSSPPKTIMYGHMTGLFRVLSWSPLWLRDLFFTKRFKLNKVVVR